jgi:uncharacterized protein (TIGR03083 family)
MSAAPLAPEDVGALWDRIIALADGLDADQLALATPCTEWDVKDLLAHCAALQTMFDGSAPQPEPPAGWAPAEGTSPTDAWTAAGVVARRDWSIEDVLGELRAARDGHVARLAAVTDWDAGAQGPAGPTTEAGLVEVRCFDLWVHLWDLHTALGETMDLDDRSPAAATGHRFVFDRVPWMYAKKAGAPEGSTMRVSLGPPLDVDTVVVRPDRRAAFDPDADPGDCAVTGSPAALTLLCSGRESPEHWREQGGLDWSGERGAEFVARARLF